MIDVPAENDRHERYVPVERAAEIAAVDVRFYLPGRVLRVWGTLVGRLRSSSAGDAVGPASLVRATGQRIVPSKTRDPFWDATAPIFLAKCSTRPPRFRTRRYGFGICDKSIFDFCSVHYKSISCGEGGG